MFSKATSTFVLSFLTLAVLGTSAAPVDAGSAAVVNTPQDASIAGGKGFSWGKGGFGTSHQSLPCLLPLSLH
jgi:hypothetical protein